MLTSETLLDHNSIMNNKPLTVMTYTRKNFYSVTVYEARPKHF